MEFHHVDGKQNKHDYGCTIQNNKIKMKTK